MLISKRRSLQRNFSHQTIMKIKDSQLSPNLRCQDFINRFNKLKDNTIQIYPQRLISIKEIIPPVPYNTIQPRQLPQIEETFQNNASFESTKYTILNIQKSQFFKKEVKRRSSKHKTLDCSKVHTIQTKSEETIVEKQNLQCYQVKGFKKILSKKYSFEILNSSNDVKFSSELKKSHFHKRQSKQYYPQVLIYYDFLKKQAEIEQIQFERVQNYQDQPIHFAVGKGNNNQIITDALKKRWWWKEFNNDKKESLNLLWTQLKDKSFGIQSQQTKKQGKNIHVVQFSFPKAQKQPESPKIKCLHNHFSSNKYFGSKLGMYTTLKSHCKKLKTNVYKIILPIFYVQKFMDQQWKFFTSTYFQSLQINKMSICDINLNKKYWLVKQSNKNMLKNKIFCTYKQIKKYVQKQSKKGSTFIIQQYISKPFLYKKRKFDIKCFVLITRLNQKTNFYIHKEGFINIACDKFDILDLENQFSHFTIDSVQTKHRNFGQYQPGNKIDFTTFQTYLHNLYGNKHDFIGKAVPEMKQVISKFLQANYQLLNQQKTPCFQLIQCEFIMDQQFKPWLIDVHTNPCLQTYCPTLQKIIKTVIEDTCKHTVDILFPPPLEWLQSKQQFLNNLSKQSGFVLINNKDQENQYNCGNEVQLHTHIKSNVKIYQDQLIDDTQCSQQQHKGRDLEYLLSEVIKNKK